MQPEKLLLEIPVYEGSPGYPPRYKLPSTDNLSSCPEVSFYIAGKNNSLNFMTKTGLGKKALENAAGHIIKIQLPVHVWHHLQPVFLVCHFFGFQLSAIH